MDGNTSAIIESCIVSNNAHFGILKDDLGFLQIRHCDIFCNTRYGVRTWGTNIIDAEHNWWGHSSGPYHPDSNPGGLGDTVSDYVDFIPWLTSPGVEEQPIVKSIEKREALCATIIHGHLQLPRDRKCKVFDITGRVVAPDKITLGIYFIEVDGVITQKVVKVR
jgi:hypothetical protein